MKTTSHELAAELEAALTEAPAASNEELRIALRIAQAQNRELRKQLANLQEQDQ